MKKINILELNLHDAKVEDITIKDSFVIFSIPKGLNKESNSKKINACKLKFELIFPNECKAFYSRPSRCIFSKHKNKTYKSIEFLNLDELSKFIKSKNGFEILTYYFDSQMKYVNFDCLVNGNEPLRVELDILSAEVLV